MLAGKYEFILVGPCKADPSLIVVEPVILFVDERQKTFPLEKDRRDIFTVGVDQLLFFTEQRRLFLFQLGDALREDICLLYTSDAADE